MANGIILELERVLILGPVDSARVLGIAYSTYAGYKSEARPLPPYVRYHAEALVRMPAALREELKSERLMNETPQGQGKDAE